MKKHGLLPEMEPPFDFDYFGIVFDDYKTFTDHRKPHLGRPNIQCVVCERVVMTKQTLKVLSAFETTYTCKFMISYTDFTFSILNIQAKCAMIFLMKLHF